MIASGPLAIMAYYPCPVSFTHTYIDPCSTTMLTFLINSYFFYTHYSSSLYPAYSNRAGAVSTVNTKILNIHRLY